MPTLRQAIAQGSGVASPGQPTFAGNTGTVSFDSSFRPRVRNGAGVDRTYTTVEAALHGLQAFTSSDESDFIMLTEPGSGIAASLSGGFDLTYTTFGVWAESNVPFLVERDNPRVIDAGAFYAGVPTPTARMPTGGTARFRGAAVALEAVGLVARDMLAGPLDATADFARSRLDASTELSSVDDLTAWGTVTLSNLLISGNGFAGGGISSTRGHSGTANGNFMGPDGQEIGGVFVLSGPTDLRGAFVAVPR